MLGFLTRLLSPGPPFTATHDLTYGLEGLRNLISCAQRKDAARLEALLRAEPDPDTRHHAFSVIASEAGVESWIREWVKREPNSSVAQMLWGEVALDTARKIRGSGRAHDVPQSAWMPFLEWVQTADAAYLAAAACDPEDPVPWGLSISSAMLRDMPVADRLVRLDEALTRNPRYSRACWAAVYAMTKKWGGSHKEMFSLAHRLTNEAPKGSTIPVVVCLAHAEMFLYGQAFEKVRDPIPYFPRETVGQEILTAHDLYRFRPTPAGYQAANAFAFCFYLMEQRELAKAEFLKVQGLHDGESIPWCYAGGTKGYAKALKACW